MIIIPFLFFVILTIYWWKTHQGLDICTYMTSLYAVTTLFAIFIYFSGDAQGTGGVDSGGMLWSGWEPILGFIPTVSFCLFIGLAILPFSYVDTKKISNITERAPFSLLFISSLLIITALINLYCVADSTLEILGGDFAAIRHSAYLGDQTPAEIKAATLPFPLGHLTYLNFCTTLALPIMFYNICFTDRAWWWNALLFFTALTPILSGIQRADRTEFIYFAQMFLYCIIFFRHNFSKKVKRLITGLVIVLVSLGVTYIAAVSMARFDDKTDGGAITNVIQYAGQGYLNYCYFCENASFERIESEREFPIANHLIAEIDSNDDRRGERSARQGFFISVFATFIGDILLDLTPIGMFLWILSYSLISIMIIRWRNRTEYDISEVLILFVLASIPVFGIFYYRYHGWFIAFNFIILLFLWFMSKYKIIFTANENTDDNSNIQCDAMDTSLPDRPSEE